MVEAGRCRHQLILAHFDEVMHACGTSCDVCTGVRPAQLAAETMASTAPAKASKPSRSRSRHVSSTAPTLDADEEALFQDLRALRKELADRQGVPAYIVFSDKVLVEMVKRRPSNDRELLAVSGVGPAKLEKYGEAFLGVLTDA